MWCQTFLRLPAFLRRSTVLFLLLLPAGTFAARLQDAAGQLGVAAGDAGFNTAAVDPSQTVGNIIQYALSLLGVIALVLIIYGGFLWMTASGNEEQIKKAKGLLTNAAIGLFIIFGAYAITYFVVKSLATGTLTNQGL